MSSSSSILPYDSQNLVPNTAHAQRIIFFNHHPSPSQHGTQLPLPKNLHRSGLFGLVTLGRHDTQHTSRAPRHVPIQSYAHELNLDTALTGRGQRHRQESQESRLGLVRPVWQARLESTVTCATLRAQMRRARCQTTTLAPWGWGHGHQHRRARSTRVAHV